MDVREPSAGPPWDLPIAETPFAFVDLEMTGLDPEADRIIEVCIHRTLGTELVERFSSLVNPGERADAAFHIHGIGSEALAAASPFAAVGEKVVSLLEGAVFVAHGARWDVRFLRAEAMRAGIPLPLPFYLDTLNLARRSFARPTYALPALAASFEIPHANAHRAEADVLALRAVFAKCVEQLKPESARDLFQVRVGERKARDTILESAKGAIEGGVPVLVTFRPSRRAAESFPMVIVEVRAALDPPLVAGYDALTRSRRELRADRIVGIAPYDVSSGKNNG